MWAKTVKCGLFLSATTAAWNGPEYKKYTRTHAPLLDKAIAVIIKNKLIDFDINKVRFYLKPTNRKTNNGVMTFFDDGSMDVILDPRRSRFLNILETLCHELVHVEQCGQGRMKFIKGKRYWNSTVYSQHESNNYDVYRNSPWEKEAFSRQGPLAAKVLSILESDGFSLKTYVK